MAVIASTGKERSWLAVIKRVTDSCWFGASNNAEQAPLALNNEYILAVNNAGTGTANLIKATTGDVPQIADSAVIATVATGATAIVNVGGTQTLTNKTFTGAIVGDTAKCSTQFDAVTGTTGATLTNVIGLVTTVVPGTYRFYLNLPGVATANCGIKTGFKLTTTVLTSIEATGRLMTAAAVAVQHTTTATDQATLAAQTAAVISTVIEGTMVVGTGGTIQLQAAQNVAHVDTTSVYVGASMTFTRIA